MLYKSPQPSIPQPSLSLSIQQPSLPIAVQQPSLSTVIQAPSFVLSISYVVLQPSLQPLLSTLITLSSQHPLYSNPFQCPLLLNQPEIGAPLITEVNVDDVVPESSSTFEIEPVADDVDSDSALPEPKTL